MRKTKLAVGNYYHVLNRGNEKQLIFFEPENYSFFLKRLIQAIDKWKTELICYCLMPNHFHLILKEIMANGISNVMLSLQTSYAKAINKRFDRVGHLFQGPFKNVHIDRNEYLVHLSRYIHMNPVECKLVSEPEEWWFSSYLDYIGLKNDTIVNPEIILSQFVNKQAYRDFVMEYKDDSDIEGYTLE